MSSLTAGVTRRALVVWGLGVAAYAAAVFHRTSLGVVAVEAGHRLGLGASSLAALGVLQLSVYAAMQLPVGVLLDRFGARGLLAGGAALMAAGQLTFALAQTLPVALGARLLLGVGDAMTFVSVLRLVADWFPGRLNPVMVQTTGAIGQGGALLSALPLVVLMRHLGWTGTYLAVAAGAAVVAVAVLTGVRNRPASTPAPDPAPGPAGTRVRTDVGHAWREAGTRLGFWSHFSAQFSGLVFGLLWGFPFLTQGEGLPDAPAAALLMLLVAAGMVGGPLLGRLVARHPYHRSTIVLTVVGATAAAWTVVLAWPGRAPLWLLVGLVLVLAVNGPSSAIGFDFARTFNPRGRLGTATGMVNVGGFTASLVTIALIGVVVDATGTGGTEAGLDQFRLAFATQYAVWALGASMVWRYRRRTRRDLLRRDPAAFEALRAGVPA